MDETEGEVNLTVNTELEVKNNCELDEDIDQAVGIFEFTDIFSYVAVIMFSLNEPVQIKKRKVELQSRCMKFMNIILENISTRKLHSNSKIKEGLYKKE